MGDLDDFLADNGVPAEEVAQAEADGTLELLVAERLLRPNEGHWDLDALAGHAGLTASQMSQLWRAMGFPDPEPGEIMAGDADLEIIERAGDRIRDPFRFERTLQTLRVASSSLARLAEDSADDIGDQLAEARAAGLTPRERAEGLLHAIDLVTITRTVGYLYRLQLLAAVRRRLTAIELGGGQQDLSIGFVDLVDFTVVSQELEPDDLAAMVSEFESRAYETVAQQGARVVKTIGDEVMFSTPSPAVAVSIALRLTADVRRGPLTPDVRGAVAHGPVVARWGDAFGPVVNLASRLVNVANPGTVLVSDEVHDLLVDQSALGLRWRELRSHHLKGIGRVKPWRVSLGED